MKLRSLGMASFVCTSAATLSLMGADIKDGALTARSLLGVSCGLTAAAIANSDELMDWENLDWQLWELVTDITNGSYDSAVELMSWGKKSQATQQAVKLIAAKAPLKGIKEMLYEALESEQNWLDRFMKAPHKRILGKSGDGKTHLALLCLAQTYEDNADLEVFICDANYGKGSGDDGEGEPNDWLGIDPKCISDEEELIVETVEHVAQIVKDRAAKCTQSVRLKLPKPQFHKVLLVIDEEDSTQDDMEESLKERFHKALKFIAKVGRAYNVNSLVIGQDLDVNASGIRQSTARQFANCMVGVNCFNSDAVKGFKSDTDRLIADCKAIKESGVGFGPCIVQFPKQLPQAKPVPKRDIGVRITYENQDPDAQWWATVWTPEIAQTVKDRILAHLSDPKNVSSPRETVANELGIKRLDNSIRRYAEFLKPAYDALENELKSKV